MSEQSAPEVKVEGSRSRKVSKADELATKIDAKVEATHGKIDGKILANPRLGCFVNLTSKWGCALSDTTLRKPLLTLSLILVLGSVVTQKFAFIGMIYGFAQSFPWTQAELPTATVFRILYNNPNYTGGFFVDPEGLLIGNATDHQQLLLDLMDPENPRTLYKVPLKISLVELCFYPYGPGLTANWPPVDLAGESICMKLSKVAERVGEGFNDCYQSSTGMYLTVSLGLVFGCFGGIDTFTRWAKYKDGKPNDRGHFKCFGVFIFVLTFLIDLIAFLNYDINCYGPISNMKGVAGANFGLGFIFLWIQFGLNHGANLIKLSIPSIDVRELPENGGAKTNYFGKIVVPAGEGTPQATIEMHDGPASSVA